MGSECFAGQCLGDLVGEPVWPAVVPGLGGRDDLLAWRLPQRLGGEPAFQQAGAAPC